MNRSLPPNPSLRQLRNQARDLLNAHKTKDPSCCGTLRRLHRFEGRSDEDALTADLKLTEVQYALAMEYGFKSWADLKRHVDSSQRLLRGVVLRWEDVISGKPHCTIEGNVLIVENPRGEGPALHTELGGMSWDKYRLGVDVLVERNSSKGRRFPFNVQFCPRGTTVYCQLFGDAVNLDYWDNERQGHAHVASVKRPAPLRAWHRFEILVQSPNVELFFNGERVISRTLPVRADGMPGLVVNYDSDVRVRLRDLRIAFLALSRLQIEEYHTDPSTNWRDYKCREIAAERRESMDDNSL